MTKRVVDVVDGKGHRPSRSDRFADLKALMRIVLDGSNDRFSRLLQLKCENAPPR